MTSLPIPIIFCLDVEPDGVFLDRDRPLPWTGFEAASLYLIRERKRIEETTGRLAHFNWFLRMDPQIGETYGSPEWAARHYAGVWEQLQRQGDEIGLHVHAYRWIPESKYWLIDHGNQEWVKQCVVMSFAAYREAFGKSCASFRFGDRWMNNETIGLLENLGAGFDLTVEPGFPPSSSLRGMDRPFTGFIPDYRKAPYKPYKPLVSNFLKPDPCKKSGIWMVPLTTVKVRHPFSKQKKIWLAMTNPAALKKVGLIPHMNLDPDFFKKMLDILIYKERRAFLTIGARTHVFLDGEERERVIYNMNILLQHPVAARFAFMTPSEALTAIGCNHVAKDP